MGRVKLTEQQTAVVKNRGGDLLVSAAAGAGKTEVLAERLMSAVVGEKKDIHKFLIITYTRDAAAQLRAKITNKLSEALAADPHNSHLQRQMQLVYAAQISTVHSFCGSLLRSNAAAAGLTPDFRVADESECQAIRADVMNDVMEQVYTNISKTPNIAAFLDLTVGRDDLAVQAILHKVYDTVQSHPWPDKWMDDCVSSMEVDGVTDAAETPWGRYIMDDIRRYAARQLDVIDGAMSLCDADPAIATAYLDALQDDYNRVLSLSEAVRWNQMFEQKEAKWTRLKSIKKGADYDLALQERVKDIRSKYKDGINGKLSAINGLSADVLQDIAKTAPSVSGMFDIVRMFSKAYRTKKQSHNILDYSDLEHYTIQLLLDEATGQKTEVGESVSQQYQEIVVDEYQDTNAVQETIFAALSNGSNRFMVGDVKQSIYAFRLADPTIFLQHYDEHKPYQDAANGEPRKIALTKNFRSRPEILVATNTVMQACMSKEVGGITYDENETLVAGRTDFIPLETPVVELVTIDMSDAGDVSEPDDDGENLAKVDVEAHYVASRIRKMLDGERIMDDATGELRPIKASDIAILLRAAKNGARHYIKALADEGIASKSTKNGSLLDTEEITTLYCFLQVVDNPYQDVPLVGILASPLFGFTAEDLAQTKLAKRNAASFFEALQAYAESSKKAKAFLDTLEKLRNMVPYTRLAALYNNIVELSSAQAVYGSYANGTQREDNIFAFREVISDFERTHARGLFQFICHIEALREQGVDFPQPAVGAENDAVTVMSTHTSKGLEFPVVFISDLSRKFNQNNLKNSVLLDRELGAGVQVYDIDLDYRYPTIARNAIAAKMVANSKSEEMRILYVAMTRAKQRLIMTYCDNMVKAMDKLAGNRAFPLPPAVAQSVNCPGSWILLTTLALTGCDTLSEAAGCPWAVTCVNAGDIGGTKRTMEELEAGEEESEAEVTPEACSFPGPDVDALSKDLDFIYPHDGATRTASTAAPTSLHRTSPQIKVQFHEYGVGKKSITPAQRGTAIHKFMQFANYQRCAEGGAQVQAELNRIKEDGFMSSEEAEAIDIHMLKNFFASSTGKMLGEIPDDMMKREFRFSLLVPASEALPDAETDEPVLMSGIIDLFVDTGDSIALYDFKSDYAEDTTAIQEKVQTYSPQLNVYAKALEQICSKPVAEKTLIFLRPAVAEKVS